VTPDQTLRLGPSEITVIGLLITALLAGWRGVWVWGATLAREAAYRDGRIAALEAQVAALQAELKQARADRDTEVAKWQDQLLAVLRQTHRSVAVTEKLVERVAPAA
jgi:hypothetical protein